MSQKPLQSLPDPLLVSHGFQINYERGFSNGLVDAGLSPVLVNSDRSDAAGMHAGVRLLNLRGSQEEHRPRLDKALNLLRYHARLLGHVMLKRPAIVHVIGLIDPAVALHGLLHGLWFRLWAGRYVLTVHDLLPQHGRHTPALVRMHRWSYHLPHHLVVHTPRMRDELIQRFGVPPDKITVMEHGIEPVADDTPPPPPYVPQPRFRLLAFGRILRYKGVDVLLDALHRIETPIELTLCGRCRDADLAQEIREGLAALPAHVQATWRDEYVDEAEVAGYFHRADALVLPYRHIDQSGVLFQALRFGVPVVATDVGQFARYIDADVGEICPTTDDPQALAEALQRLIARRPLLSQQAILQRAAAFEWPKVLGVLAKAYGRP